MTTVLKNQQTNLQEQENKTVPWAQKYICQALHVTYKKINFFKSTPFQVIKEYQPDHSISL